MKLKNIASFVTGPNLKEQKKLAETYKSYSAKDLVDDLKREYTATPTESENKYLVKAGDLVVNLMTNKAAVVSKENDGKYMSQRIMKITPKDGWDRWYLCFLLNESFDIKNQEYREMEGTVVKRVTAKTIKNLETDPVDIEKQKNIGNIYRILEKKTADNEAYIKQLHLSTVIALNDYGKGDK